MSLTLPSSLPEHHLRIGRQGIHDRTGTLVAHEVLFRGFSDDAAGLGAGAAGGTADGRFGFSQHDHATSQVIAAAFVDFGLDHVSDGRPVFVNLTRAFLVGELPLPFGSDGVVLEVLEDIVVDDELLDGLRTLRARGFQLAADDFAAEPERMALLDLVDIVKLDLVALGAGFEAAVGRVRALRPDVRLLAEKVEDRAQLARARAVDVDLYQGYLFTRPDLLRTVRLSPTQVVCLRLLRSLADPSSTVTELETIIAADPGLMLRVLRTANSAATGSRRTVSSLRQAVVLLGPPVLGAWVTLTLLGGLGDGRRDHLVTILARALACEDLAGRAGVDRSTAYTAGMLAGVSQVLGIPLDGVAASASVDPVVRAQLRDGTGPLGALVAACGAVDADDHASAGPAAAAVGLSLFDVSRSNLRGWSGAMDLVRVALDGG